MPALGALGAAWRDGSVTVAGEHFVSGAVTRRLAASFDAAGRSATGPCVVVGLARGSRHELGVLAFATALRRAGLDVVYVGGDLPGGVGRPGGRAGRRRRRARRADAGGRPRGAGDRRAGLPAHPDVALLVGGGYQSEVGGATLTLGHAVGPAARQLVATLSGRSRPAR